MNSSTVILSDIIDEHLDEASFLWLQRDIAVHAPNYTPQQFADLDERIEAHIDGLRVAGEDGWNIAYEALAEEEPENFFPASVLALESGGDRFNDVIKRLADAPEAILGVISALGWVSEKMCGSLIESLVVHESPINQKLGIAAYGLHRIDPGDFLSRLIASSVDSVRIRSFRTAGDLGRIDLLSRLINATREKKSEAIFWAARSAVLLGNRDSAIGALRSMALEEGLRQLQALQLVLHAMDVGVGDELLSEIEDKPNGERLITIGLGYLGNVQFVPWIFEQMENPQMARVAGEAFVNITGADYNLDQLEAMPPEGFEDGPTDDPDDEVVEVPEDIALPWPDVERAKNWWNMNKASFNTQTRYFIGKPVSETHCLHILKKGYQRQRISAAQHLCLIQPGRVLFPTSAPAPRQKKLLESLFSN